MKDFFKLPPSKLPKATTIEVRGQVQSMNTAFEKLGIGIVFAVMLVYFLMVVNFQSWLDPMIIIMALPGAFSGILWMLFATHTTFSVPSLMGTIMCIGVATSNSILLITFANDQRLEEGASALDAALAAGTTRLRPVLMTALAMILGMIPMSLGLGEGGEQNAPLGRAVIGGLLFATATTLFFVPVMYSIFRKKEIETVSEEDAKLLFEEGSRNTRWPCTARTGRMGGTGRGTMARTAIMVATGRTATTARTGGKPTEGPNMNRANLRQSRQVRTEERAARSDDRVSIAPREAVYSGGWSAVRSTGAAASRKVFCLVALALE